MLMPDKHIRLCESILGLAAFILQSLSAPKTLDTLWDDLQIARSNGNFPAYHTIDNLAISVSFLYAIDAIRDTGNGTLAKCDLSV
jgi:hypothetical protein